ncbi:MAG: CoB--CoM heterodisulfide reductase iron-sulfur subunit B family protein [Nitrospinota bacterium]
MKYALYTGCVAKGAGQELYTATMIAAERLGIDLEEMKDASCCGAGFLQEDNHRLGDALNARTFSLAEERGLDIMTICGTCQGVMGSAKKKLDEDPAYKEQINAEIEKDTGRKYRGNVKIKHLYQIIEEDFGLDNLAKRIEKKFEGLKVAPFYGCYALRPHEEVNPKIPDRPDSLDIFIKTIGATPVDYDQKQKCCGFPIMMTNKTNSLTLSGNAIQGAVEAGADCILTPCPLCHLNMDAYMPDVESMFGKSFNIPILHYPQLLALALGATPKELKLKKHIAPMSKRFLEAVS